METNINLLDKIAEAQDAVEAAEMYAAEWKKEAKRRKSVVNSLVKTQQQIDPDFNADAFLASIAAAKAEPEAETSEPAEEAEPATGETPEAPAAE